MFPSHRLLSMVSCSCNCRPPRKNPPDFPRLFPYSSLAANIQPPVPSALTFRGHPSVWMRRISVNVPLSLSTSKILNRILPSFGRKHPASLPKNHGHPPPDFLPFPIRPTDSAAVCRPVPSSGRPNVSENFVSQLRYKIILPVFGVIGHMPRPTSCRQFRIPTAYKGQLPLPPHRRQPMDLIRSKIRHK